MKFIKCLVVFIVMLFLCFDVSLSAVNTSRPRVWIDTAIKTSLEQQVTNNTTEWQNLKSWCDQYLGSNLDSGYRGGQWYKAVLNYALAFQATGNQIYGNEGVKYLTALIDDHYAVGDGLGGDSRFANDDGGGNAYVSRFVGAGAAIGRDWLSGAANLDDTLINRVGARISNWINYVKTSPNVYALHDPYDNFWAGHFSFFYTAAISLYGDANYDNSWWAYAYNTMWTSEALPVINGTLDGGDWQEGFNYGPFAMRNIFLFQHAVKTGTDLNILNDSNWNKDIIKSQIHMLYPSRNYVSDDGSWSGNYKGDPRTALILAASALGNVTQDEKGLAAWRVNKLTYQPNPSDQWESFLWRIETAEIEPSKEKMGGLSYRTGYGHLLARSAGWSNTAATFVDFTCPPYGSVGQGERNVGEFKIASRGELLVIDGDTYQDDSQYANVLLINGAHTYAPRQDWWRPNTTIDRYHESETFVYARGVRLDNAYDGKLNNTPSVTYYSRELLFVYPDYIFIMDSVVPTSPSVNTITSQIHMRAEPVLSGSTASIENGSAKLFMDIRGHDVSLTKTNETLSVRGTVWNVKATPLATAPNYKLLHVFQAADSSNGSMKETEDIVSEKLQGVRIGNTVILFNKDPNLLDIDGNISYSFKGTASNHVITGLKPLAKFSMVKVFNGLETSISMVQGEGAYIASDSGTLSITFDSPILPIPEIQTIINN